MNNMSSKEDLHLIGSPKIKLTEDDFVLVGMNYNYYMIPRLAYPERSLEDLKQQILKNQKMAEELRMAWNDETHGAYANTVSKIMEKYFGKRE